MEHIINPVYYQDFILAGKCEFTIRSVKTGNEEMFVINKSTTQRDLYWVNNRMREHLGFLKRVPAIADIWNFEKKSDIMAYQEHQIKIFSWLWHNMMLGVITNDKLKAIQIINPYNRCAHCHRTLTHPESIPIGIGPDCFKKLGLTHKTLIHG